MRTLPAEPSSYLFWGFVALSIAMILGLWLVTRSWKALTLAGAWAALTGGVAYSGWTADFSAFPPRAAFVLLPMFLLIGFTSASRFGDTLSQLPVRLLVGFQAFRILVEVLIHQAVVEGVAPAQLSWEGLNFDIVTGVTALILMFFVDRCPRWLLLAWNTMGLLLVLTVVTVAILSMPTPLQRFDPENIWIGFFPFIWLPTILVFFAITGHLVLYRKLLAKPSSSEPSRKN